MGLVRGFAREPFAEVEGLFEDNLAGGADLGASFCATLEGEIVVELWGGWMNENQLRPWQSDTIVNVYSTTKTMTALVALMLADRGELDFEAPVARYWPQFAAAGKAEVTVSQVMAHSAGLSGWRERLSVSDLYDWDKATSLLAAQVPYWPPGTAPGYHGLTQGYLIGEIARRITGRSLGTFFREEIAEPLGADFHIGLAESEDHRVAELTPPPPGAQIGEGPPTALMLDMAANPPTDPLQTRTRAWRAAEIPAAGGHGAARAVARIHAILANGGVAGGRAFMSEAGCRRALEPQIEGVDLVLNLPVRFGLGFGLPPAMIDTPNSNTLFWGGYGGSLALIDLDARATFAYAMNRMQGGPVGDPRAMRLVRAMWSVLGRAS
jgi:CubicO group peptidase (beta-lactamase class C family)